MTHIIFWSNVMDAVLIISPITVFGSQPIGCSQWLSRPEGRSFFRTHVAIGLANSQKHFWYIFQLIRSLISVLASQPGIVVFGHVEQHFQIGQKGLSRNSSLFQSYFYHWCIFEHFYQARCTWLSLYRTQLRSHFPLLFYHQTAQFDREPQGEMTRLTAPNCC